jgi:hypothetical protein
MAFIPKREKNTCWVWQGGRNGEGEPYGRFGLKQGKTVYAHRYARELIHGPIPEGVCVLHKCDNPPCVNPDHLFLGTRADNNADKMMKGRFPVPKGELNGRSILTEQNVHKIRDLIKIGIPLKKIACRMQVAHNTIYDIATGRRWSHI